jgi:hypothetical protein
MVSILVNEITPRIEYTMNLVFNEIMGIPYSLSAVQSDFERSRNQKINYTRHEISGCLQIMPSGLLSESGLTDHVIEIGKWKDIPTLFAGGNNDIPFDIFSAIFYIVSRYEEYIPFFSNFLPGFALRRVSSF